MISRQKVRRTRRLCVVKQSASTQIAPTTRDKRHTSNRVAFIHYSRSLSVNGTSRFVNFGRNDLISNVYPQKHATHAEPKSPQCLPGCRQVTRFPALPHLHPCPDSTRSYHPTSYHPQQRCERCVEATPGLRFHHGSHISLPVDTYLCTASDLLNQHTQPQSKCAFRGKLIAATWLPLAVAHRNRCCIWSAAVPATSRATPICCRL